MITRTKHSPKEHAFRKDITFFGILLICCGLAGILASLYITPEVSAKYIALDGHVSAETMLELAALQNLAWYTGWLLFLVPLGILLCLSIPFGSLSSTTEKLLLTAESFEVSTWLKVKWNTIAPAYKKAFVANLLFAVICHGFLLSKLIINWDGHDALNFEDPDMTPSGRWLTQILGGISEYVYLPFPYIATSLILLALAGTFLAAYWRCRSPFQIFFISAPLISFPAYAVGLAYNWICYIYPLATLFTILSLEFMRRKGWLNAIVGIGFFILMLATYQGFIAFGFALMLFSLIQALLYQRSKALELARRFAVLALTAPVLYKISSDLIIFVSGKQYNTYKGADQISLTYIIEHFPANFIRSYQTVLNFFSGVYHSMPGYLLISLLLLIFIAGSLLLARLFRGRKYFSAGLAVIFVILSPSFVFATVYLNVQPDTLHTFGLVPLISFSYFIILSYRRNIIRYFGQLLILLIVLGFVNRSNQIHLKNHLWTQTSMQLAADLALRISALPDFSPELKLVRIGNLSKEKFPLSQKTPFQEQGMSMVSPTGFSTYGEAISTSNLLQFLGFNYPPASKKDLAASAIHEIEQMPVYPEPGAVKIIDRFIVVKFSE